MNVYEIFKVQQAERESCFYQTDPFAPLTLQPMGRGISGQAQRDFLIFSLRRVQRRWAVFSDNPTSREISENDFP